ncbi:MAG TPA: SCP2 sterol-binding domain-containing protein [Candidatus Nanopelagicaceae bacterium]|nr:SCP2 sterol-binding domain-containing protein [Candidatus Nanopelagicaceae bacterium]
MADEELLEGIKKMVSKLDDPANQERFKDFDRTLQFDFTDTNNYYLIFKDAKCEIKEGEIEDPSFTIITSSDVIIDIMDGELSPTKAFMGGKIKAKGPMRDMLKMQILMK